MQLPDIAPHFTRFTVFVQDTRALTPGLLAQQSGLQAEQLGPIVIAKNKVLIDVHESGIDQARTFLAELGSIQERRAATIWFWLRIEVGRNHGLTIGQMRKVINRGGATKVGKIEIANTHARFGIAEEQAETLMESLQHLKINGFPLKPTLQLCEDGRAGRYGSKAPPGNAKASPAAKTTDAKARRISNGKPF